MAKQSGNHELITPSPAMFAGLDNIAFRSGDACALVGRVLLGWLFFIAAWPRITGNIAGFVGYVGALGMPAPQFFAWAATLFELTVGLALIFGVATRYAALLTVLYLVFITWLAHRYWTYPAAQQMVQYINFLKNLSVLGGMLLLFVTGAGRFSVDGWLKRRG